MNWSAKDIAFIIRIFVATAILGLVAQGIILIWGGIHYHLYLNYMIKYPRTSADEFRHAVTCFAIGISFIAFYVYSLFCAAMISKSYRNDNELLRIKVVTVLKRLYTVQLILAVLSIVDQTIEVSMYLHKLNLL